jgi:hypothetical protein
MNKRHPNTAKQIESDGQWVKVGRRHYRHCSGNEVRYDCNAWGYKINGRQEVWPLLYIAKYYVETNQFC